MRHTADHGSGRQDGGLTEAEIARAAGTSDRAVSFYLSGRRHPQAEVLPRLAHAVGVADPLDLCGSPKDGERIVHLCVRAGKSRAMVAAELGWHRRPTGGGRPAATPRTRWPTPATAGRRTPSGLAGAGGCTPPYAEGAGGFRAARRGGRFRGSSRCGLLFLRLQRRPHFRPAADPPHGAGCRHPHPSALRRARGMAGHQLRRRPAGDHRRAPEPCRHRRSRLSTAYPRADRFRGVRQCSGPPAQHPAAPPRRPSVHPRERGADEAGHRTRSRRPAGEDGRARAAGRPRAPPLRASARLHHLRVAERARCRPDRVAAPHPADAGHLAEGAAGGRGCEGAPRLWSGCR
ncbi:helix-turn-helix domain-containing protein [Streptomyces griseofuscus]|uniref:helix-turn-helix domain-containing protein n=1 Tax=Streptomyces griseofuscus TaxID=146922 RepID=UPI0034247065